MCKKVVYQTFYDLHNMQEELRNLRKLQDEQKQNKTSSPQSASKNSEKPKETTVPQEEYKLYKDHFSRVGKILSTVDPEHDRDELCWIGDKQVSVNGELSKMLKEWSNTSSKVKELKKSSGQELPLYKEFFNNANKVTALLMGAAGQSPMLFLKNDGNSDTVDYEEVNIEEMRKDAAKQVGR